ncbi:hypothetical protein E4T50_12672 [Aureobasidium sp. EXF-12298]|nr:hypothetical protein E4T50_12672 [Aureobasidium sp. EXF-12298]
MRCSLLLLPVGAALVHAQSLRTVSLTACATQSGVVNCLRDGTLVPFRTLSSVAAAAPSTTAEPSTTQAAASAAPTAITSCHMHGETQFCFAGDSEYEVLTTATATEELPSEYTGCHAHAADLFCFDPKGEEVEVVAEGASHNEVNSSGATTPAVTSAAATGTTEAPKVTALSGCHMHETQQFCLGPSATEYLMKIPATATGELPTQYTGCHAHGAQLHCVDANGNTVEGTCEAVNRDYNIPLRIGLVFAILATASIGVFGPIFLSLGRFKSGSIVMSVVKQFGTGVIISTALVHLFTHAELMFANHCLGGLKYEATTAAIVMAGIVISFVPEYVGARIFLWRLSKHSVPASPTPEQDQDSKRAATNEAPVGHHLIHSGDAQEQSPALQKLKVNIMEAGIIFHSLFVAGDSGFITLFIVIVFHQMFEGLALGSRISNLQIRMVGKLIMAGAFAVVTPIGMAIGIGVLNQFNGNDPSTIIAIGQTLFSDTQFELPLINDHFDAELNLPDINDFQFGKLDKLDAPSEPAPNATDTDLTSVVTPELDDLWRLDLSTPTEQASLRTWEAFADKAYTESPISYISDAGPRAFDALQPEDTNVLQSAFTLKCLALLGLGRSSALYQWKKERNTFVPALDNARLSGLSSTAFNSLVHRLTATGCAFALLEALDQNLAERVLTATSSLRLLACFDTPTSLLTEMRELVDATSQGTTDTAFLSPWFQTICQKTGLTHQHIDLPSQDDILEHSAHVSAEDSNLITEVMTGFAVLRDSAQDHPLLHPASWGVDSPGLDVASTTMTIDRLVEKANKYQQDLLVAISMYSSGGLKPRDTDTKQQPYHLVSENLPWSLDQGQQTYFEDVATRFSEPPARPADTSHIRLLTARILEADKTQDTSSLDLRQTTKTTLHHLQPYLHVQSRLLNGTLLRLLFRQFSLRDNLTLNYSFQLLGNGLFVQHLTRALFNSESNAQGLRLDNRSRQWPPASSELRLGLMGVLSESYGSKDIPGNLSFAIRELSDAEIEKCLDANSIHALDFLRLRYEAPTPLDSILSDTAMAKYDDCFRVLLGVLRMLHFVTLLRNTAQQEGSSSASQAFAHEAWNCVSGLAAYFFDIGVAEPWKQFQHLLDTVEADLAVEDEQGTFGQRVTFGISHLRNKHDDMLDTIRSRLFLRSRHDKLRTLIEDMFSHILNVQLDVDDEDILWNQRNELRVLVQRLQGALQELTRKIGKKKELARQDRDDIFAAEVLSFRLGGE